MGRGESLTDCQTERTETRIHSSRMHTTHFLWYPMVSKVPFLWGEYPTSGHTHHPHIPTPDIPTPARHIQPPNIPTPGKDLVSEIPIDLWTEWNTCITLLQLRCRGVIPPEYRTNYFAEIDHQVSIADKSAYLTFCWFLWRLCRSLSRKV